MTASIQGRAGSLSYLDQIQQDTQVILRREECMALVRRGPRAPGQEMQTRGSSGREMQIWKLTAEQHDNIQCFSRASLCLRMLGNSFLVLTKLLLSRPVSSPGD